MCLSPGSGFPYWVHSLVEKFIRGKLFCRHISYPVRIHEIFENGYSRTWSLSGCYDGLFVSHFHISCSIDAGNISPVIVTDFDTIIYVQSQTCFRAISTIGSLPITMNTPSTNLVASSLILFRRTTFSTLLFTRISLWYYSHSIYWPGLSGPLICNVGGQWYYIFDIRVSFLFFS